jgi:PAS domain S-box-containing protein
MLDSQDDLAVVLDHVADGVTVQDRNGRLVYANQAAAQVLGFSSPAELLATPTGEILQRFEMFDEAGEPFPLEHLPGRRALAGFEESAVTIRFRAVPAGEDRWSRVHASPVRDGSGCVRFAVNVWHDVTEQKETETSQVFLAEAGELLASSLDIEATLAHVAELAVPRLADWCAVHLVREDGELAQLTVVHVDPAQTAWARALQERYPTDPNARYGVPEVVRTGRSELIPEVTDEMLAVAAHDEEHLALARRVGLRSAIIVPLVARDRVLGAITFASAESGRRYGERDLSLSEELARRAAIAIDNAHLFDAERVERARAEDARLQFRALFEGVPDAILVLDGDAIIDVNAGACDLLQYSRDQLMTRCVIDLAPEGEDAPAGLAMDANEWRGSTEVRRRDGAIIPVELWFRRLSLPAGGVRICAMRDISERRAYERAREEVLAAVSHDLRNPIGVIKAHVQLLRRSLQRGQVPDPERLGDRLATIDAMGTRMSALLEDMAVVARLQRGDEIQLELAPVDLVELVRRCAAELATTTARQIDVQTDVPSLVGRWDGNGLERVVYNVLGNAIKYSPDGERVQAKVSISRDDHGAWAELSVKDDGIGIPERDIPRVFDAYHRAANVGQIRGTGIGLAGARHIIEGQGGSIGVASREGQGTTVTVRLPAGSPETA